MVWRLLYSINNTQHPAVQYVPLHAKLVPNIIPWHQSIFPIDTISPFFFTLLKNKKFNFLIFQIWYIESSIRPTYVLQYLEGNLEVVKNFDNNSYSLILAAEGLGHPFFFFNTVHFIFWLQLLDKRVATVWSA